ncbi:unnamed protein product [Adineta steineri]|uniref:Uncharacterized protein n=1 Tax=Adineta steineri TaxID=433720 RepID=A0A813YXF9_9BILA|nr:unnamed protein product [Adineta steineri]CAF0879559.1 unnamed protein product [Adineta steineri]CAF0890508.1 unnamed protein product [Adineta steineri]
MRKSYVRLKFLYIIIAMSFILNTISITYFFPPLSSDLKHSTVNSRTWNDNILSTIERSTKALEKLKRLLSNVMSPNDQPWIWISTGEYPSVPYQPTKLLNEHIPKTLYNVTKLPKSVINEVNRVCKRLKQCDKAGGEIWCKLFQKTYVNTLETTTTLLDDNSTYIITGDIDLMWLRDSSAQVHQYLPLWNDSDIQRIIEGLIRRQIQFIYSNPYGSAFRLKLRPNPPSDDSLLPIHTRKGRNVHVAMHNYELDSLCYHIRLSYSWWKQSQRTNVFDDQWLVAISMIIQVMIIEQHHTQISPYRYTELQNNYQGIPVAYTGMTWSGFRPSDDPTTYGYLIPSNMMASVVLEQLTEMIINLFPEQIQLLQQIAQLQADILSGLNTYGVTDHPKYGKIYAYETDGFSKYLLVDDANVPSLLSASYFDFKTPYDPSNELIQSTRQFILSKNNTLFFEGKYASGIGSQHTQARYVWPMAIIMEGLTMIIDNKTKIDLDYVWERLEVSHADTFAMHESFNVENPKQFSRPWFAWVNSLFSELILTHLDHLEEWLRYRRPANLDQRLSNINQRPPNIHPRLPTTSRRPSNIDSQLSNISRLPRNLDPQLSNTSQRPPNIDPRLPNKDRRPSHVDPRLSNIDPQLSNTSQRPPNIDPQLSNTSGPPSNIDPQLSNTSRRPSNIDSLLSNTSQRLSNIDPQLSNTSRQPSNIDPQLSNTSRRSSNKDPRLPNKHPRLTNKDRHPSNTD